MTTQKNTLINFDIKSQLAKLIATENISIQHNNVKTASFDTVNRVLTLPIFKVQSGDVYDMLIAHECSHALFTPTDGWKKLSDDDELRAYVNVLEDTRIDRLIQKKYPGVVKNYLNGFDIMDKQNFFGLRGKNVNTDLMLIDKINMRSKSSNRVVFKFSSDEKQWLPKVDALKTFNQVVELAKEMLNWQKKHIDTMKKLPDFDNHVLVENYGLDEESNSDNNNKDSNTDDMSADAEAFEKKVVENLQDSGDENVDDKKDKESNAYNPDAEGGGTGGIDPKKLIAITDQSFEQNKEKLLNTDKSYTYFNLPEPKLEQIIISSNMWIKKWKQYISKYDASYRNDQKLVYLNWLKDDYKKYKNDNRKTVNYLVKEFEMKKSATAYKRATVDKTGVIDSLKLKNYKFSDDIFKRLTVLPNAKNHGMMMLLDWSGSMCDSIKQTIDQLMNLIWFCQKINIPYEVYLFTSEADGKDRGLNFDYDDKGNQVNVKSKSWKYKHGDGTFDDFNLINVASHKMNKKTLDESLMYLHHMGLYYGDRYTRHDRNWDQRYYYKGDQFQIPEEFWLGTTPLNEALVAMNKLVPMFKAKYHIEKMTFITLTDGGANSNYGTKTIVNSEKGLGISKRSPGDPVITIGKKQYKSTDDFGRMTTMLLDVLRTTHNITTLGFYIVKRLNRMWELDLYIGDYKDYSDKINKINKLKKSFTKEKMAAVPKPGYNRYFLLNGKTMNVENTDLTEVNDTMKVGKIKQLFSKSMKGRIVSRSLLNKFIEEVA